MIISVSWQPGKNKQPPPTLLSTTTNWKSKIKSITVHNINKKQKIQPDVEVHAYNPGLEKRKQETYQFIISLNYTVRPCLKIQKQTKTKTEQKQNKNHNISMDLTFFPDCIC